MNGFRFCIFGCFHRLLQMVRGLLALRKASPSSNVSGSFFLFVSGSSTVVSPT